MDLRQEKKRREDFLVALWEMHNGNYGGDQPTKELCKKIGVDYDTEGSIIGQYLYRADMVQWSSFEWISLTPKGIMEAERIVELRYAEKETLVLKKIYELSGQNTTKIVGFHELVPALGMTDPEVSGICKGLEERGFIEWPGGDYVNITSRGIHAIESLGQPPPKGSGDTYQLNIGTSHGPIQQGSNNTQNIQINITNNPEFDQAMAGLLQLIEASRLPADEIQELRDEVTKLNKLALSEPRPGLLEKAKARIDVMKVSFEGAKLLVQAAPYLHTAWEYFKAKHS
jgi:Mn-dependent DtxR family transcriptional regulator